MLKRRIDENGLFIEDVITEEVSSNLIEIPVPEGFYRAKWNGQEWIEGLTVEEINTIKSNQPKTEIEILKETVDILVLSML